jgi:hypothetical protein
VYKDIKMKTFPPLRPRPAEITNQTHSMKDNLTESTKKTLSEVNPRHTYADVTKTKQSPTRPKEEDEQHNSVAQTMKQFLDKFEKLMYQQAQQIGTLMNLLTTVISKLK